MDVHARGTRHFGTAIALVAIVLGLAVAPAGSGHAQRLARRADVPLVTVQARIRVFANPKYPRTSILAQREVTFRPRLINVGKVRIIVSNSDRESHSFEINGVSSRLLRPGGRQVLTVTFKRPGLYPAAISSETPVEFSGQLRVLK
jgi:hypothetical protein